MVADRDGGARRRPVRVVLFAACGVVLLAGCASMPDTGDLRNVESTPRQDTQMRVFAMAPRDDAEPGEIVQGFLEALTSDDPHYDTARKYLTAEAARKWRPEESTTVLANAPSTGEDPRARGQEDHDNRTYTLAGTKVATVDEQQAYSPADGEYSRSLHLTHVAKSGQWRIMTLPQGVVVGKSDFQRNYSSVNKYYLASNTSAISGASAGGAGQTVAVADPVFVRRNVDPMTQMVRSLLHGPSRWLRPVVRSSFPTGSALGKGVGGLTPDDQNKVTVPLNDKASRAGSAQCTEMAAQVLFTLQNLTPTVGSVELRGSGGRKLCDLADDPDTTPWRGSVKRPGYLYFLDGKHRLVRIAEASSSTSPVAVPGAFGEGDTELRSVAVSRDERTAAGVGVDGKSLYVASLVSGGSLGDPVVRSRGAAAGDRLTAPSWDSRGDLWVADRDPRDSRLLLLEQGAGRPVEVQTPELPGRIKDMRVAADGVRMALVVEKDGKQSLLVGRIERDEKAGEQPVVSVMELHSVTPRMEEVTAMSWAGDSRLVVGGREKGGVPQLRYVQTDGATPNGPAPAALTGVQSIAATENDQVPLVAYSDDGIVRLSAGAQWQTVIKEGSAPVYPG